MQPRRGHGRHQGAAWMARCGPPSGFVQGVRLGGPPASPVGCGSRRHRPRRGTRRDRCRPRRGCSP
eukprot:6788078-Alexandrium_andersonii.AAC.1